MLRRPSLCSLVVLPLTTALLSACSDGSTDSSTDRRSDGRAAPATPAAAVPADPPADPRSTPPVPPATPGGEAAPTAAPGPTAATAAAPTDEPVGTAAGDAPGAPSPADAAAAAPPPAPVAQAPDDPLSPQPPLETPPPAAAGTCRAADLSVADADSLFSPTALTEVFVVRTTGADCRLQGYPGVRLLGPDGAALPVRVRSGGGGLPARDAGPVTLSRSTSVSFLLSTSRDEPCVDVATVAVTLPGTGGTLRAPTELAVCGGAAAVSLVGRQDDDEHGDEDGA